MSEVMYGDGGAIVAPRQRLAGRPFDHTYRPVEVGDHVEIQGKWAKVIRVRGGSMTVVFLGKLPDPGKQSFPEYELRQRSEKFRNDRVDSGDWPNLA